MTEQLNELWTWGYAEEEWIPDEGPPASIWVRRPILKRTARFYFVGMDGVTVRVDRAAIDRDGSAYSPKFGERFYTEAEMESEMAEDRKRATLWGALS